MEQIVTSVNNTRLSEWLETLHKIQFEPKIFHPEFSLFNQSTINVCFGVFIFGLLLLRRAFPARSFCRSTLKDFIQTCLNVHLWHSLLIWLAMVLEGKPQERNTILAIGLSVFLYAVNNASAAACDAIAETRAKEEVYRRAIDDALILYGVSEAYCREVISDGNVVRSFLTLVHNELNLRNIHDSVERTEHGKLAFEDLLARHRLHQNLVNSPHIHNNYNNWRNYGVVSSSSSSTD
jgi:hypothetical protein